MTETLGPKHASQIMPPVAGGSNPANQTGSRTIKPVPSTAAIRIAFGLAILLGLGALSIALWALPRFGQTPKELSSLGSFLGGTAGPMMSLASVLLLYAAFRGQQHQLGLQEAQLESQRELMNAQTTILTKQTFENSFFTFLRFQRDSALTQIARPAGANAAPLEGLPAFSAAAAELIGRVMPKLADPNGRISDGDIAQIVEAVCLAPHSNFGHYFRTLYYLVQFTAENGGDATTDYMRLVRAQLSNDELTILFFNGLGIEGRKTFKERIEKYGLLKGLRLPSGIEKLRSLYTSNAFADE